MMKLVPVIALAVLVATPAFAGHKHKRVLIGPQGYYQQHGDWRASRNYYRGNYITGPNVVSPSGRYIGRDPSLNVRQRMYDDDIRLRNQF
jgi:hypothetical protein